MATYDELLFASENEALNKKIRVAVIIAAETIRTESPATPDHVKRVAWAKQAFTIPDTVAEAILWAVLAQNKNATYLQIVNALDSTVQTAVDAAVNVFLD